jgi:hypothetical protein
MAGPKQCRSEDKLKDVRCQGIPGHKGPHWAYDEGGHLIRWVNKLEKDPRWKNVACSWTPPGHKSYIPPTIMNAHHYITIWARNERKLRRKK